MTKDAHEEVIRKIAAVYRSLDTSIDHEGLTTESSENLMRLQDGLDRNSLAYLYVGCRILGARMWFLIQIDAHPHLGVWVPLLPRVEVISRQNWQMMDDSRMGWQRRQSPIARSPISTRVLCDILHRFYLDTPAELFHQQMKAVRQLDDRENITQWQRIDVRSFEDYFYMSTHSDGSILAVPYLDAHASVTDTVELHRDLLVVTGDSWRTGGWDTPWEIETLYRLLYAHYLGPAAEWNPEYGGVLMDENSHHGRNKRFLSDLCPGFNNAH